MRVDIMVELEPAVEKLLDNHLNNTTAWDPVADYIPWGAGVDFRDVPWQPGQSALSPAAQTAVLVNLATEDDLPGYRSELGRRFGDDGPWGHWLRRWTAEEGRHSIALRALMAVSRGVDPAVMEANRMETVQNGFRAGEKSALRMMAYVTVQELATRVAHFNTGREVREADAAVWTLLRRIAEDENHHMLFYRDLVAQSLDAIDRSAAVEAVCREIIGFTMPGEATVPEFRRRSATIARAGIYNLKIHHDSVLKPLLRHWRIFDLGGLDARAEKMREQLAAHLAKLQKAVLREQEILARRAAHAENQEIRT